MALKQIPERRQQKRILCVYFPNFQEALQGVPGAQTALTHLAQWAYRFSPIASPDYLPTDIPSGDSRFCGLNIDVTGCEKLFNGEVPLAEKISSALDELQLRHRIAIAPSLGAAWALSRYGDSSPLIIQQGATKSSVISLPIASLRLSLQIEQQLKELNISTIEEIIRLPRRSLLERFGKTLLDRIDQTLGVQQEIISPVRILTLSRVEMHFEGAVTDNEVIKAAAWKLLRELLQKLQSRHLEPSQIIAQLQTVSGEILLRQISLSRPTYNRKHLSRMLERKLDTIQAPYGVEKLALIANRTEQFRPEETQFLTLSSNSKEEEKKLGELIDTLVENLGREQILVPQAHASHIPENSYSLEPIGEAKECHAPVPKTDRPSFLFPQARLIRAMAVLPDGPPFWLKWKDKTYAVQRAIGPERLSAEWWKGQRARDYFKVQIPSGTWLWIYRELEGSQWFLQGMWA